MEDISTYNAIARNRGKLLFFSLNRQPGPARVNALTISNTQGIDTDSLLMSKTSAKSKQLDKNEGKSREYRGIVAELPKPF
jgi:hypothetical protein